MGSSGSYNAFTLSIEATPSKRSASHVSRSTVDTHERGRDMHRPMGSPRGRMERSCLHIDVWRFELAIPNADRPSSLKSRRYRLLTAFTVMLAIVPANSEILS